MKTRHLHQYRATRASQQGMATLFVTVIVVLLVTLLTYTMATTNVVENRMSDSDLKSKQAFHAAQAGLDFALQKIMTNELDDLTDPVACGIMLVDEANPAESPTFQLLYGLADPSCPSPLVGMQTRSVIRSIGRSSDGGAVRVLEVAIDLEREWVGTPIEADPSAAPPPTVPAAIVSRGKVELGGTTNAATCATIDVCLGYSGPGNPKPNISGYYDTLVIAGGSIDGGDTGVPDTRIRDQHKDPNRTDLAGMTDEQFFAHIMGVDKATYQDKAKVITAGESLPDVNVHPAIWFEGDLNLAGGPPGGANESIGTPDKPVTLVVTGDLKITGGLEIWGVVYVMGSEFSAGNSKIFGALVGENTAGLTTTGTSSVFYNEDLGTVAPVAGFTGEVASVMGDVRANFDANSWREVFFGP